MVLPVELDEESGDEFPKLFASRRVPVDFLNLVPIGENESVDSLQGVLLGGGFGKDAPEIGFQGLGGMDSVAFPMVAALGLKPV